MAHRRVVHAKTLDWRVEQVEALLVDERGDGGADAARVGALVEDADLVGARERRADRRHVERLERAKLDQVDVESFRLVDGQG